MGKWTDADRRDQETVLRHPRRRLLQEVIRNGPGVGFREVARETKLSLGVARHHLNVLLRFGLIKEHTYEATMRFFPAGHDENWIEVVLRREPALATLHDWLKSYPRSSQGEILEAMAERGWPRSTTQHRLGRLVTAGLASIFQSGRFKLYSAPPQRIDLAATAAPIPEAAHASA